MSNILIHRSIPGPAGINQHTKAAANSFDHDPELITKACKVEAFPGFIRNFKGNQERLYRKLLTINGLNSIRVTVPSNGLGYSNSFAGTCGPASAATGKGYQENN